MFPIIFLRYVWSPSHIDTPTRICHSVYRRRNLTNSMTSICFGCERHRILLRCNGRLEILPHTRASRVECTCACSPTPSLLPCSQRSSGLSVWMRSHLLARRTRSLVKTLPNYHRAPISSTHALRYPRKDRVSSQSTPRLARRAISSEPPISEQPEASASAPPPPPDPPANADPPPLEDAEEKPKRRGRTPSSLLKETENVQLPAGLNILWTPEDGPREPPSSSTPNTSLPPPEIFNEALHNLHIALHPKTQHRATYASSKGPIVEPTLALYCPIEGGDYILDETVREMARQTGADVVVLDAVQLAAGECGHFGKGTLSEYVCARSVH